MFAIVFLRSYDAESDTSPILRIFWDEEGPCTAESAVQNKAPDDQQRASYQLSDSH
jgi:hypothetical protein